MVTKTENAIGALLIVICVFAIAAIFTGAAYCDFDPSANLSEGSRSPCLQAIYLALTGRG